MTSFTTIAKIFARIGNALHKKGDLAGAVEAYDSSLMESHSDDVYARRKKVLVSGAAGREGGTGGRGARAMRPLWRAAALRVRCFCAVVALTPCLTAV